MVMLQSEDFESGRRVVSQTLTIPGPKNLFGEVYFKETPTGPYVVKVDVRFVVRVVRDGRSYDVNVNIVNLGFQGVLRSVEVPAALEQEEITKALLKHPKIRKYLNSHIQNWMFEAQR